MLDLISNLFPFGRTFKLVKMGISISNSTSPLVLTKNITLVIIDCRTPPPLKLAAHCVAAGSFVIASAVAPNPVTIGATVHIVSELYEKC